MNNRRAVFLDRDGTIIEDTGYPRVPADIRLLPGAAAAIRQLNQRRILAIVVTNQSGIARGLLTMEEYAGTEQELDRLLREEGAHLDAHYFCPHFPELSGPCDCRKPGTLLYRQAADRFGIDLSRSWWVGDRIRDVLPAMSLGGRGIVVGRTDESHPDARRFSRAESLSAAVDLILASSSSVPAPSSSS